MSEVIEDLEGQGRPHPTSLEEPASDPELLVNILKALQHPLLGVDQCPEAVPELKVQDGRQIGALVLASSLGCHAGLREGGNTDALGPNLRSHLYTLSVCKLLEMCLISYSVIVVVASVIFWTRISVALVDVINGIRDDDRLCVVSLPGGRTPRHQESLVHVQFVPGARFVVPKVKFE